MGPEEGNTPLMEAVIQEKKEVVICLIKHGANILHKDCNGDSALNMAERYAPQLHSMLNKIVNPPLNKAGHRLRELKTKYSDNKTASLEAIITSTRSVIDSKLIELHASRRVDLFFFILIAYYKTNLRVEIEDTHIQHGMGKKNITSNNNTVGCHSAILPSVFDTRHQESPAHIHSTRHNPGAIFYRTSILNNTDFEHSLNATVQLHESVNYFDSHFIEGQSSASEGGGKMRIVALAILNQVSRGEIDPIIGMKYFFQSMYTHLLKIKNCYLERKTLPTSPIDTRLQIYKAQFRGTFFNACGFDKDTQRNPLFELRTDYIRVNLPFSAQEREELKERPNMHLPRNQSLAKQAYLQVKNDMELPLQYQHI